ncbi:MAG: FMN-binding protein [Paludibacteraceae bacterium]|nr:FMN-binding protein [Prevotella sp.]MBQ8706373.1 FMN-binding protein [Paludibacteraceae bacterium]MBQ8713642.1 FMN-binding protein [Prevotella sp.]
MKKLTIPALALLTATFFLSAMPDDDIMVKEHGVYIINTTALASDVEGYENTTPLKIYIKKNKIIKIEALRNQETPKYFAKVKKQLLDKWNGMTVKQALATEVDGVTGATYSSKAVKENVRRGISYYKQHK